MTVHEVSRLTGVSVRALHHYDAIGLLPPAKLTAAGYRIYDDESLRRLQCILLFRALEFPLKEIREILDSPEFDRERALEQQIRLLELRRGHLEQLLSFARNLKDNGGNIMDFQAFDTKKLDEYTQQAKKEWGNTAAYAEFEKKNGGNSAERNQAMAAAMMRLFTQFGELRGTAPEGEAAQAQVRRLQDYITENYYTCTVPILAGLGQMYAAGGEMTDNIDRAGGAGTAQFAADAIAAYVAGAK